MKLYLDYSHGVNALQETENMSYIYWTNTTQLRKYFLF